MVSILLTNLLRAGFSFGDIVQLCCTNPAMICRLQEKKGKLEPGYDADVIVVEKVEPYPVNPKTYKSQSKISPYQGNVDLEWRVSDVIVNGDLQVESGYLVGKPLQKMPQNKRIRLE